MEAAAGKKHAVVTGANKGIGFETVRQLAAAGVTVVLTARDAGRGIDAARRLCDEHGMSGVLFHQLDVRDPSSVAALAAFIEIQFGKLDILVNNAAISGVVVDVEGLKSLQIDPVSWLSGAATEKVQGVIEQTYENAAACLDTNYYGCKRVTEALLPLLKLSPTGARIVNVSSLRSELKRIPSERVRSELGDLDLLSEGVIEGVLERFMEDLKDGRLRAGGWPEMLPSYSMSKVAVNAYTRVVAASPAAAGMCVNCVHPGYVNTDINWRTGVQTVEEGARGPVMLALLPSGGPSGCYFDQLEVAEF